MRAARTACTVAGICMVGKGVRQAIGPRLAYQGPGLHQRPHALLQEEGIALGALDQELREGCQTRVIPQEGLEEGVGTRRGQGVQPQLRVVGLAPPAVPVVRPVVDQQQQRAVGRLSPRLSSSAWVSVSSQCRSSQTSSRGCTWLWRSSTRLRAASVCWRRCGASSCRKGCPLAGRPAVPGAPAWCPGGQGRASGPAPSPWSGWCARPRPPPGGNSAAAGRGPGSRAWPGRRTPRRCRAPASPGCGPPGQTRPPAATSPLPPRPPPPPPGRARPAWASAAWRRASSVCRPTKRVRPRARAVCKRRAGHWLQATQTPPRALPGP